MKSKGDVIKETDLSMLRRAIELASEAERNGNLPIGSTICLNGVIIAEGKNSIWVPEFNPNRHAEVEALRNVSQEYWRRSRQMTLYSTLEPCLMCAGAILLHHVGRVVYGSSDSYGGVSCVLGNLPPYFLEEFSTIEWIGPALPEECDPLYEQSQILIAERRNIT